MNKCKKNEILRKSYITKRGTKVRKSCIKDRGKKGKGPRILPKLRKGTLTSLGYSSTKTIPERHLALKKAVNKLSSGTVIKKLNAVSILHKNTNPRISKIFRKDLTWIQKNY